MPLDGLRAWIREVERKLGIRTRVFLVLSVIAIGAAGAAIYLAIDAHNKTVSQSDLQALQRQLEGQISGGGSTSVTQLESEVAELKQQVEKLTGEEEGAGATNGSGKESGGAKGTPEGGGPGGSGKEGAASNEASTIPPQPSTSPSPSSGESAATAKLKELIEKAKAGGH